MILTGKGLPASTFSCRPSVLPAIVRTKRQANGPPDVSIFRTSALLSTVPASTVPGAIPRSISVGTRSIQTVAPCSATHPKIGRRQSSEVRERSHFQIGSAASSDDQAEVSSDSQQGQGENKDDVAPVITFSEASEIAKARGLHVGLSELGPFYRITIRDGDDKGTILGVTTGFVAPLFGLMHCDTLQIFNSRMGKGSETRARAWGSPRGLGLLLGGATFAYGLESGCKKAEILAINDDEKWAKRLVRYYSHFGFVPMYEVGDRGLADIPDMLVWGGVGTRMDADITGMLMRWSSSIRRTPGLAS